MAAWRRPDARPTAAQPGWAPFGYSMSPRIDRRPAGQVLQLTQDDERRVVTGQDGAEYQLAIHGYESECQGQKGIDVLISGSGATLWSNISPVSGYLWHVMLESA